MPFRYVDKLAGKTVESPSLEILRRKLDTSLLATVAEMAHLTVY